MVSIVALQTLSLVLLIQAMRAADATLEDLGLHVAVPCALVTAAVLVGGGLLLLAYRTTIAPTGATPPGPFSQPVSLSERPVWLVAVLTAGLSEELLYRGCSAMRHLRLDLA